MQTNRFGATRELAASRAKERIRFAKFVSSRALSALLSDMWARQGIGARADSSEACFGRGLVSVTVLKNSPVGMLATQGKVDALVTEVANREECWTPTGKKLAGVVHERFSAGIVS